MQKVSKTMTMPNPTTISTDARKPSKRNSSKKKTNTISLSNPPLQSRSVLESTAKVPDSSDTHDGYNIREYVVQKRDQRLLQILLLPCIVAICILILWSQFLLPIEYTVYSILIVMLWACTTVWNTVNEETLVVVRTLGIQVSQKNILGKMKTVKFVPIENIKAVVINEIIRRQRVIAYLLVMLNSAESTGKTIVPLLIGTLPRLRTIEKIYTEIQHSIF